MGNAKKIISLLLCVALCFALAACGGSDYTSERKLAEKQNAVDDKGSDTYEIKAEKFSALTGYTVIYPDGNEQLRQAAQKLVNYFAENEITVTLAADTAAKSDTEILVGDTNRQKSSLAENEYAVSIQDNKLFFESGNFNGVVKAVFWFIAQPYTKGEVNTITGEYEFSATVERPSGTYNFVWSDEFDGNLFDENKWELTSSISAEGSFKLSRDPEALRVEDGLLKLTATRWLDPDNNQIQAIAPYTVESKAHMNFQYGYMEMRARIPLRAGAWPSLWLSGACREGAVVSSLFNMGDIYKANFSAEFDIVEYTSLQPNFHKWFYNDIQGVEGIKDSHSSLGAVEAPVKSDLRLDPEKNSMLYHIVAFDWTPEDLTIYINDEKLYHYNWEESIQLDGLNDMTDFLNPAFVRLNNHLIPKNFPSDYSTLPAEFYIDYVRLYQKPETGGLWLAE
ncbi:MAG: glycoside hydrolase family 16 protein [Clostridia bacterium]|nr:glycoside hydrolase family 16 protein [Clostridia bacterium]